MREYIARRVLRCARYLLDTGGTVRETARYFGVSKTTIHKDMRERLPRVDPTLTEAVAAVLCRNHAERHLRGGQATKRKYAARRASPP